MAVFTVHEAKTNLSRLIADAEAGKEVVIARGKKPAVRMVPVERTRKRTPGMWKGQFEVCPGFFDPMSDEELRLWEGSDEKL